MPAIILAAGASRRLGQPKQLVRFEGETLLERTIGIAKECGVRPIVVLGAFAEEIAQSLNSIDVQIAFNPDWEQGMATSIKVGLLKAGESEEDLPGIMLLVCDQIRLGARQIEALLHAWERNHRSLTIASGYAGAIGIPAVFPRSLFPSLMNLKGDEGARTVLKNLGETIVKVPFDGGHIDVDTPQDLIHLS